MSQLMPDDVLRFRRLHRRSHEGEAESPAQQTGLAALMDLSGDTEQSVQAPPDPPHRNDAVAGALRQSASRGPAWLREDVSAAPAGRLADLVPRTNDSAGGRHRQISRRAAEDEGPPSLVMDVRWLSGGSVRKISRSGPVLAPRQPRRRLRKSTFAALLSTADRIFIAILSLCWAGCLADFWVWWLEPAHRISIVGSMINSIVLIYLTCYPVFFVIAANRLRSVRRSVAVPLLKVAFVVTRAPSEPWNVARSTLEAMLGQEFPLPYDVWLCDERPTSEVIDWCARNGVIVATRNGAEKYHRATWPRRTRCKEGNLAYFYDHWGYRNYDVVAQLDCDHRPSPTYLAEMIRPFSDPAIGYVAAPSVCDANAAHSWPARGRLYREATFHGAFQLGHSDGWAPSCIGSHYAVRTQALRAIGGIGPELAEDFSTSFLLNSAGWHGAFAIDAEAHGDGPNTFSAMLVQEFQWSRSLTTVLFGLVPRNLGRLSWPLRLRFLYALFFYSLLVTSTLGGLALAPFAAVTGRPWINVNYIAFLLHWWSISFWLVLITLFLRRRGMLRPRNAPILSWENWLYTLARWPYIARGICSAMIQLLWPRPTTFKVTPKGSGGLETLPARLIVPYILISAGSATAALYGEATNNAAGYVFLCIAGGFIYSAVAILVPLLHAVDTTAQSNVSLRQALRRTSLIPLVMGFISILPVMLAIIHYPAYAIHVFHWHWRLFA
jgi:cellulose synthase (UDP-forming)